MRSLEQLKKFTTIVSDTGDFESIKNFKPQDATTNPSLIYSAYKLPQYKHILDDAIEYGKKHGKTIDEKISQTVDKLAVNFGMEILKIIPGRVSTELDARLSFDIEASIEKGRSIIQLYKDNGVDTERVLIKVASTWEGIQVAKQLEKEGIHCNMTLLFSLPQAVLCAEAGVTLISPFAGRITDYYKKKEGKDSYPAPEDPGVVSVKQIFNYYKQYKYKTVVMGASFRNKEQIIELAGCDFLTVSPTLLGELEKSNIEVVRKLDPEKTTPVPKMELDEKKFRWLLNEDDMANDKLAEGIRRFAADLTKLESEVRKLIEG